MKFNQNGMTLIEVLVATAISSIITVTIALMLHGGMTSWQFGQEEISIQRVGHEVMDKIVEGDYEWYGIRDAIQILKAKPQSIDFVPLWTDEFEWKENEKSYTLTKQFKPGSPVPIVQVKAPREEDYSIVEAGFKYGEETDPDEPDDIIEFTEPLPRKSKIKVIYHPEGTVHKDVIISYTWNPLTRRLYRSYKGVKEDFIRHAGEVKIKDVTFEYFNNYNDKLKQTKEGLSNFQLGAISACKVTITAEANQRSKDVTSFVNMRAMGKGGLGYIIQEGTELRIPNSEDIGALMLTNIKGVKEADELKINIKPERGNDWNIHIWFSVEGLKSPMIAGFEVDYPKGHLVLKSDMFRDIDMDLDFLRIGGNGLYDYDDDLDVEDKVILKGEKVILKVTKMDIDGAALFIRP